MKKGQFIGKRTRLGRKGNFVERNRTFVCERAL